MIKKLLALMGHIQSTSVSFPSKNGFSAMERQMFGSGLSSASGILEDIFLFKS